MLEGHIDIYCLNNRLFSAGQLILILAEIWHFHYHDMYYWIHLEATFHIDAAIDGHWHCQRHWASASFSFLRRRYRHYADRAFFSHSPRRWYAMPLRHAIFFITTYAGHFISFTLSQPLILAIYFSPLIYSRWSARLLRLSLEWQPLRIEPPPRIDAEFDTSDVCSREF